ncbi:MAG: hypothetical protein M3Z21_13800 [Pseudomonadota bacterium]|nr:hypothetical protein [Pseudomonadota bacterium]
MPRQDLLALVAALLVTALLIWGLVYFVRELWPTLSPLPALLVFIFLAVAVIGYPIFVLARWSDRYLARIKAAKDKSAADRERYP